jgi:hypothetical protein
MRAIWSLLAALLAATLVAQPTDYTLDTGDVISGGGAAPRAVQRRIHCAARRECGVPWRRQPAGARADPAAACRHAARAAESTPAQSRSVRLTQAGAPATGVRGGASESPWRVPNPTGLARGRRESSLQAEGCAHLPERATAATLIRGEQTYPIRPAGHLPSRRPPHELPAAAWRPAQRPAESLPLRVAVLGEVQRPGNGDPGCARRRACWRTQSRRPAGSRSALPRKRRAYIDRQRRRSSRSTCIAIQRAGRYLRGHPQPAPAGRRCDCRADRTCERYAIVGQVDAPGLLPHPRGEAVPALRRYRAGRRRRPPRHHLDRITILRVWKAAPVAQASVVPYQRFLKTRRPRSEPRHSRRRCHLPR